MFIPPYWDFYTRTRANASARINLNANIKSRTVESVGVCTRFRKISSLNVYSRAANGRTRAIATVLTRWRY